MKVALYDQVKSSTTQRRDEMQKEYAVRHKETGLLFAGFDAEDKPQWTADEKSATAYKDQNDARGQALLFSAFEIPVQKKPVVCKGW